MLRKRNSMKRFISSMSYSVKYIKRKIAELKSFIFCNCNEVDENELTLEKAQSSRSHHNLRHGLSFSVDTNPLSNE